MTITTAHAPPTSPPGSMVGGRPAVLLAMATIGFGLNFWAWSLLGPLGPHLSQRYGLGPQAHTILLALPLVVGSLARFPVGVLTDRYGARVMFPAVSLVAAVAVFGFAFAGSLPLLLLAGSAAGVGGAAFAVGAPLVSSSFPYGRRGFALGVFGLGTAGAAVADLTAPHWLGRGEHRGAALLLGTLLAGYALLAAFLIRDMVVVRNRRSMLGSGLEVLRSTATTPLSIMYAVAFGGVLAFALYLPAYLASAYRISAAAGVRWTAGFVLLAALARLLGGVLTDRHSPIRIMVTCHAGAGCFAALLAFEPRLLPGAVVAIAGFAVCIGAASGALLALICKAAPADRAGATVGVVGAAGGLGAILPPLVLGSVYQTRHSYALGLMMLAGVLLGVAIFVRANAPGVRIGLALPFGVPIGQAPQTTVVILCGSDTGSGGSAIAALLAELATRDELVVVYSQPERTHRPPGPHALVAELRILLPRHRVVAVLVGADRSVPQAESELLRDLLHGGTVTVACTTAANPTWPAVELASQLDADRVLQADQDPVHGARLRQVWARVPAATTRR